MSLIKHKGQNGLYSTLKKLNLIANIDLDENSLLQTSFRFISFELELTEFGLKNYKQVLALVFEYIRKIKDEWIPNGIDLFEEMKTVS